MSSTVHQDKDEIYFLVSLGVKIKKKKPATIISEKNTLQWTIYSSQGLN